MSLDFIVPQELAGRKLSSLLHHDLGVSSTQIKSAKWDDRILVNGQSMRVSYSVQPGDHIQLMESPIVPKYAVSPLDVHLDVLYEDSFLLILSKPAGMATSSSLKYPDDALENALFSYLGMPSDFLFRPVNRLDKGTSGLMCVARDAMTQHALQSLLHTPDFQRTYLAVTDGIPENPAGTINLPIAKMEGPTIRREIREDGKPSVTHYQVLETSGNRALLQLDLETGRTHQIRVHLASIGCPVFGDFLYGSESRELPGRFALHSFRIVLRHPQTGACLDLSSPLPDSLRRLLN